MTIFLLQIFQLGIDVAVAGMIVANVMVLIYIMRIMMAHLNAIQQNVRAGATQCLALANRFSARQKVHIEKKQPNRKWHKNEEIFGMRIRRGHRTNTYIQS